MGDPVRPAPVAPLPSITTRQPAIAWRAIALQSAVVWGATRLGLILITYFTVILNNRASPRNIGFVVNGQTFSSILNSWQVWDAGWYLQIAKEGYFRPEAVVFFPLYPLLIHIGSLVFGRDNAYVVALVIANLGALAGFIGLGLLAVHESGASSSAGRTVRIFSAWPLAFFLFAPYTEGLFLAFVVWTLLSARRGSWWLAATCAFLASLTRPTGVTLFLPLVWEFGRQQSWWQRSGWKSRLQSSFQPLRLARAAVVLGAIPLALALYLAYVKVRFGHASLVFSASHFWDRQSLPVWRTAWIGLRHFLQTPPWSYWQAIEVIDYGSILLFLVLTVVALRSAPFAFTLFNLATIYVAVSQPISGLPDIAPSAARYLLAAVPVFLLLGRWSVRHSWLEQLLIAGGFMLQGVLVTFFLSNGWVG